MRKLSVCSVEQRRSEAVKLQQGLFLLQSPEDLPKHLCQVGFLLIIKQKNKNNPLGEKQTGQGRSQDIRRHNIWQRTHMELQTQGDYKGSNKEGVTRESSWGKLINKQVTRWVGVTTIDNESTWHTEKLGQKPRAHTKQKHKHMANKQSPAMCKNKTRTHS